MYTIQAKEDRTAAVAARVGLMWINFEEKKTHIISVPRAAKCFQQRGNTICLHVRFSTHSTSELQGL